MNKYGNKKTELDGMLFDSKHEANRWIELKYMEQAGLIDHLQRQVKYELIPNIYEGKKCVQRATTYIADFKYIKDGEVVVEDAKSPATKADKAYKIKKKLMRWVWGIDIREV